MLIPPVVSRANVRFEQTRCLTLHWLVDCLSQPDHYRVDLSMSGIFALAPSASTALITFCIDQLKLKTKSKICFLTLCHVWRPFASLSSHLCTNESPLLSIGPSCSTCFFIAPCDSYKCILPFSAIVHPTNRI